MICSPSNLPQKSGLSIQFIYFLFALILAGCDGGGAGEEDGGVQDGTVQDGGHADAGDADTDADTDTDSDSDADGDSDSDADADLDAGEDACMYDPEDRVGWVRTWGGEDSEQGNAVAVAPDDTIIVVGDFRGTSDMDPGPSENLFTTTGLQSAFISKFTPDGGYLWTGVIGGTWLAEATSAGVMSDGSIVVGGNFNQTADFDPGPDIHELDAGDKQLDAYVLRLSSNGEFDWVYRVKGDGYVPVYDLAVSHNDNVYFTGDHDTLMMFEYDGGTDSYPCNGERDVYIAKIDVSGRFLWARSIGTVNLDRPEALAVGPDESVVFIGQFEGTMDFDPGPGVDEYTGDIWDIFLIKLDADGNYEWGRHITRPGIEFGPAVTVDDDGNIYMGAEHSGPSSTIDFDPQDGVGEVECTDVDCFSITKYSQDGEYIWTNTINCTDTTHIDDLIFSSGSVIGIGHFLGFADFDPGAGVDGHGRDKGWNLYLMKYNQNRNYEWSVTIGEPGKVYDPSVSIGNDKNFYSTGYFTHTVDFDPTACIDERTAGVDDLNMEAFLWKVSWDGKYYP